MDMYADSAYRSAETERSSACADCAAGFIIARTAIIRHPRRRRPHSPGGRIVRTIGIAREKTKIGLQNPAYNIRRMVALERMAAHRGVVCPARPMRAPAAPNTAYSRQIMSQNHGRDAPAINSTKKLSLFEVP